MASLNPLPDHLVVYDGYCGLCDASVQRLLRFDTAGALHYTPLQGETFQAIHARHPALVPDESITFVVQGEAGEQVYTHSRAIFEICKRLPAPWRWVSLFALLPRFLTDAVYRLVARNRLKIWGTRDACRMPTPQERALFLD